MPVIYLIGSLRNPEIPHIGNRLREIGFEVFDDWFGAGKIADDSFQAYETLKGHSYKQALRGYGARHIFNFDRYHLDRAEIGILVLPAGKSGHLELGRMSGQGKPTYVLFDKEPERWDQMYQFADDLFFSVEEMIDGLKSTNHP